MKSFMLFYFFSMLAAVGEPQVLKAQDLKIEKPVLAQSEDGLAVDSDFHFQPGDIVFFSCRVTGFTRKGQEPPKMYLSYEVTAYDPKGIAILPPETGKVAADLAPEDKKWEPKIRATLSLPPLPDPGRYLVRVKVRDEFGKKEAEAEVPLLAGGRLVEPSDALVVRNFRFLRTEEDANPLEIAAYRPGDKVWARFDMTGYKFGDNNHFDIEYGLVVLRANGTTAYAEPRAAALQNDSFYPQRYTPGVLSLNLPKDYDKGEYTIVLTVRDNIGNQTCETRQKFSVE